MKLSRLARTAAICSVLAWGAVHVAAAQGVTAPTTTAPTLTAPALTAPTLTTPGKPATPGLAAPTAPSVPAAPTSPAAAAKHVTGKVNINTASAGELDALPNVGDKRSAAIIKARPYKSTNELVSKKVLSKGVFDSIKKYITI